MKKTVSAIILFFLAVTLGSAGDEALIMESMTPIVSKAFTRSGKISILVRSINDFMKTSMTIEQKKDFLKDIEEFKNKTGIDPLNENSLKETGIDTEKPLGFAYIDKTETAEKMMIFLPVLDGKSFPVRFVQIVKKMKKDAPEADVYPVITAYRNYNLYQVQKDVFCTAINDYLIVSSQGELLREAIDLGMNTDSSLAADPLYIDYLRKSRNSNDLNMFARRDLLMEAVNSFQKGLMQKQPRDEMMENAPQGNNTPLPGIDMDNTRGYKAVPVMYPAENNSDMSGASSTLNALDYLVLGLNLEPRKVQVQVGASFNDSDPMVTSIINILKTGSAGEGIYPTAAVIYGYLGLDLKKMEDMCRKPAPLCAQYAKFKADIRNDYGIDMAKDFIPASSGVFNMLVGNPTIGEYTLFLPMTDKKKIQVVNTAMQAHLKKKYAQGNRFGYITLGKNKGCWFFDKNNKKQFIVADARGLYMSSSDEFLKKVMNEKNIRQVKTGGELLKKLTGDVFFLTYIQKNMFLSGLIRSQAQANKQLRDATNSIGDIYISGAKNGNFISIDLDVAMEIVAGM